MNKQNRFAIFYSAVNAGILLFELLISATDEYGYVTALSGIIPLGVGTITNLILFIVFAVRKEKHRWTVALIWTLLFPLIGYSTCTWFISHK